MYIGGAKNNNDDRRVDDFFSKQKSQPQAEEHPGGGKPDQAHLKNALMHWRASEHEINQKDKKWYFYAGLILSAIVGYAVYTNSPVMAITFILIGMVGYIFINKEPRVVDFAITHDGVIADGNIFEFDHIQSFWIFYEPGQVKVISLHMRNKIMPYVHIPVHEENPVAIRELLLKYIPEIKQNPSAVDTFERLLGI